MTRPLRLEFLTAYLGAGHGRRAAVTIVELVVVLTIMAMLAAVAAPRVNNLMRRQRLEQSARHVINDIRLARSEAIRSKQRYSIIFEPALQRYRMGRYGRQPGDPERVVVVNAESGSSALLYQAIYTETSELVFDRLGMPDSAELIYLSDGVETAVLNVSPTTGKVTVSYQGPLTEPPSGDPETPPDDQPDQTG